MTSPILTEDDLKRELQGARCREALRVVGVPEAILQQCASGPLLFQFAHMVVFLEVGWRDALVWVNDHKGEILNYAKGLTVEQKSAAADQADRTVNGGALVSSDKG